MSSISATGINLASFFQGVTDQSATESAQTSQTTAAGGTDASTSSQEVEGGSGHHHHHGGAMFGKIEQAVTSALQSAQSSGSTEDPNQIVQDAITKVLDQAQNGSSSTSDPDGDGSSATQASGNSQSFSQMLQAMGVDPQQFHSDFLSAVQAAQGGQVDPSTAFQSFPPGTSVNTTG